MSNDKRIEVEFGARTAELDAGANKAAAAVGGFTQQATQGAARIGSAWQPIGPLFKGVADNIQSSLGGAKTAVDGVTGRFSALQGVAVGLAASLGVISFVGMIRGAIDGAGALKQLSEKSGIAVEALSALKSVAKLSDTSIESVVGASNRLSAAMSKADEESAGAAQALKALGLSVDQFKALSADDRLQVLAKTLAQYQDGAGKTAVAMALMGRQGAEMLPFLNDLAEVGALQAKTTTEQAQQADELDKNLKRLRGSGEAWKKELAYGMLPALNDASRAMLDVFNGAGGLRDQIRALAADGSIDRWTRGAVTGLTYVLDAVQYLVRGFKAAGEIIGAVVARLATEIGAIGDAAGRALRGDFAGAGQALAAGIRQSVGIGRELRTTLTGIFSEQTLGGSIRDRMAALAAAPKTGAEPRAKLSFQAKPEKDGKDTTRLPEWEAALAERKLGLAEMANAEGSFRELSKAEEAAYWQAILARSDLSEKERLAVRRKYAGAALDVRKEAFDAELEVLKAERDEAEKNYAERTRIAGEAYRKIAAAYGEESREAKKAYGDVLAEHRRFVDQQRELDMLAADSRRNVALAEVELERASLQEQQALGTVSREQVLAAERDFEVRVNAIRMQGMLDRQALIDPQRDPVAYAQISEQIEELERQHQQRLALIASQMRIESLSPITNTLKEVEGAWGGLIANMMKGTLTIGGFIRGIFKSAADAVINTLSKMAAEWLVRQIAMRAFGKISTVGDITREAGKAGAGGTASMAAAPFPLNLGAPAFGAAMSAAAMAFAPLASARGGFDIPAGLNPITQLHEKEMVLPQGPADVIRAMAAGRGGAAREPNVITQNNTFMVQGAVDRRSQEQVFAQAYAAMAEASRRNG